MNDAKEEVRARLAIEDVIGEYVQLKRAGRYWRGLSPFTNEKTPSFFVTPERDIWHDFSSGKGGDIFSFIMEMEGLNFREALEFLARKAGVDLEKYHSKTARNTGELKQKILKMNEIATNYFQRAMTKNRAALDYILHQRNLKKETVLEWGIGFAPEHPELKKTLLREKFTEQEIRAAGLISARGGEMFRGRMMIPLRDRAGAVVGFTGRIIGSGEPKYLNTPRTILYDKGRQVFGLNFAKNAIREQDFSLIVEGNLDVISSHQAGVKNVVACAGTALTREHLKSLERLSRNIILGFDSDKAGIAATERAIKLAAELDVKLEILSFAKDLGKDPDEIIAKFGAEKWREIVTKNHQPAVDWVIEKYAAAVDLKTADGKKELTTRAIELIRTLPDAVEQEFYLKKLGKIVDISFATLSEKMFAKNQEKSARRILKTPKIAPKKYSLRDDNFFLNRIFAIAFKIPRLRTILKNLPDEYLTQIFATLKYFFLDEKTTQENFGEITPEMADKLAELEIIADQEILLENDERVLLLNYINELEQRKIRDKFDRMNSDLAAALDSGDAERTKILNGAVNGLKQNLALLQNSSARNDFAGLREIWAERKN